MRMTLTAILALVMVGMSVPAFAAVTNVEVFGSIRIRGNWYIGTTNFDDDLGTQNDRFVEQRTRLGVKADFTQDVSALIEVDRYDDWGNNFRSTYETGVDNASGGDMHLYQSYIEMREAWGYSLDIRIGRQEIMLGSEWLIGNNDTASLYRGLSFDGVVATWSGDTWSLTGAALHLAETGSASEDGDTNLYALYGTYSGLEDMTIDGYWIFVREGDNSTGSGRADGFFPAQNTVELHTIGGRFAGTARQLDWEVEAAYQIGEAIDGVYSSGGPTGGRGVTVVPEVDYEAFGANAVVGYTFDVETQPRLWAGVAYFQGGDNENDGSTSADRGFNRLFSDWEYSEFLTNTDMSNALILRGGVDAQVTEKIGLSGVVSYFIADEDQAVVGPQLPGSSDETMGYEVGLYATYAYSEDLTFEAGYAHFFADDGAEEGNFIAGNGSGLVGGTGGDDDLDYVYLETRIKF